MSNVRPQLNHEEDSPRRPIKEDSDEEALGRAPVFRSLEPDLRDASTDSGEPSFVLGEPTTEAASDGAESIIDFFSAASPNTTRHRALPFADPSPPPSPVLGATPDVILTTPVFNAPDSDADDNEDIQLRRRGRKARALKEVCVPGTFLFFTCLSRIIGKRVVPSIPTAGSDADDESDGDSRATKEVRIHGIIQHPSISHFYL